MLHPVSGGRYKCGVQVGNTRLHAAFHCDVSDKICRSFLYELQRLRHIAACGREQVEALRER